jgi:hypothetical protein
MISTLRSINEDVKCKVAVFNCTNVPFIQKYNEDVENFKSCEWKEVYEYKK